jgi:hypothetical protein
MRGEHDELPLPEIGHTDLAGKVRREKPVNKPGERAQFARLR